MKYSEKLMDLGSAAFRAAEAAQEYAQILSDRKCEGRNKPNGGEQRKLARLRHLADELEEDYQYARRSAGK